MDVHALLIELATRLDASADRVGASDEDGAMAVSRAIGCIASEISDLANELADQSQQEAAQMKTAEQRIEELETVVSALVLLSTGTMAAAVGDGTVPLIRTLAENAPDIAADVRKVLHLIADAVEGRQEASHA